MIVAIPRQTEGAGCQSLAPSLFLEMPMQTDLDRIQPRAARLFSLGYLNGAPLGNIRRAIVRACEKEGVEPPKDVLAFAFPGLSDAYVEDWESGL